MPAPARTARFAAALVVAAVAVAGCASVPTDAPTPRPAASPLLPGASPDATADPPEPTSPAPSTGPPATQAPPSDPATEPADPAAPEPTPSTSPTDEPDPEPDPEAEEPATEEPEERTYLQVGDTGPEVLAVQERLRELGYFLPAADGDFGPATQQAVWALQKAAGLTRDGLVGPATLATLDAGTRPQARSGGGRVIEVDLARQLLLAVDDGVVVRTVNASSGNGERYQALGRWLRATTPTGDYTLVRQVDGMHESGLELGSMYRPKYFYKGWAVHGSSSIPPWPASHGCIRVSNAAMNWIWDSWGAPLGTRVLLY